jgi:histone deacetylase complex regulatory component SIN3
LQFESLLVLQACFRKSVEWFITKNICKTFQMASKLSNLLQRIEQETSFETDKEFRQTLELLQGNSITPAECRKELQRILAPFPVLLHQFSLVSSEVIIISGAVQFVNKVKIQYSQSPEIYKEFLVVLKEFGKANLTKEEMFDKVEELLKDSMELTAEFKQFYASNDAPESISQITLDEETPLLQDIESQKPKGSLTRVFVSIGFGLTFIGVGIVLYSILI